MITPTYIKELQLLENHRLIAGIDEVGRGPLAGPVISAVVILDPDRVGRYRSKTKWWLGVRDSKTVSEQKREELVEFIHDHCLDFAVGSASHKEIDELNIHHASLLSMKRAVENLKVAPDMVLVDGRFAIPFDFAQGIIQQQSIINGDAHVLSIAAASILAKVFRDDLMRTYDRDFPQYGFADHKGYNTPFHRRALAALGPCEIHRMTFPAVQKILGTRFENFRT